MTMLGVREVIPYRIAASTDGVGGVGASPDKCTPRSRGEGPISQSLADQYHPTISNSTVDSIVPYIA